MASHVFWRLAAETPEYPALDLSGAGAAKYNGRWNQLDTPMVYAAESRALACLETLVHQAGTERLPLNRFFLRLSVPDRIWNTRIVFTERQCPTWNALPAGIGSMQWGSRWVASGASALAQVPSIVIPDEFCILINPSHRDAKFLKAGIEGRFEYDPRLGRAG